MNIIETTGFVIKFKIEEIKNSDFKILDFFKKVNYGGGSFYQKFKNSCSEDLHEELKEIKDFDFYMKESLSFNFQIIFVGEDFEKAHKLSKVITKLVKELTGTTEKVQVSIEKTFVAQSLCLEFGV